MELTENQKIFFIENMFPIEYVCTYMCVCVCNYEEYKLSNSSLQKYAIVPFSVSLMIGYLWMWRRTWNRNCWHVDTQVEQIQFGILFHFRQKKPKHVILEIIEPAALNRDACSHIEWAKYYGTTLMKVLPLPLLSRR